MKETRRLDILAIVGGVLALAAVLLQLRIVIGIAHMTTSVSDPAGGTAERQRLLSRMPDDDVRVDVAVLSAEGMYVEPPPLKTLQRGVEKFPDSARLHFRLGTFCKGTLPAGPLRRAAELDRGNALPLYLLASDAASRNEWDDALDLLEQANRRGYATDYPIPFETMDPRGVMEGGLLLSADANAATSVLSPLRSLARGLAEHASELHASGRTDDALAILSEIETMGRKLTYAEPHEILNALIGVAVTRIAHSHEKNIYTDIGSQAGLARIEKDSRRLQYIRAGGRAYTDTAMEGVISDIGRFFVPLAGAAGIPLETFLAFVTLLTWVYLARRYRDLPASDHHPQATEKAFTGSRLLAIYALAFVVVGLAAMLAAYLAACRGMVTAGFVVAQVTAFAPALLLDRMARFSYRKAFRGACESAGAECPKLSGKGAARGDRRELERRLAGVHGGAVIFLLVWGLLVVGWAKQMTGFYPWQYGRIMYEPVRREQRYVSDLLAGKVQVPAKYLREVEQDDRRAQDVEQDRRAD